MKDEGDSYLGKPSWLWTTEERKKWNRLIDRVALEGMLDAVVRILLGVFMFSLLWTL